jgi:hypothetical protein
MTTLEIILLAILWIVYGSFCAYQSTETWHDDSEIIGTYILCIFFSPVVLIYRMLVGIFHPKSMD